VGIDLYNNFGGLTMLFRQNYFTDGNTRTGELVKAYVDIFDGMNAYISTKHYNDSFPYQGYYYSPAVYNRYNVGVGFRHKIFNDNILASGFVEYGAQLADHIWSKNIYAFRLTLDTITNTNWSFGASIGSDVNSTYNYQYYYAGAHFKLLF
jgi:hypothetical protein